MTRYTEALLSYASWSFTTLGWSNLNRVNVDSNIILNITRNDKMAVQYFSLPSKYNDLLIVLSNKIKVKWNTSKIVVLTGCNILNIICTVFIIKKQGQFLWIHIIEFCKEKEKFSFTPEYYIIAAKKCSLKKIQLRIMASTSLN